MEAHNEQVQLLQQFVINAVKTTTDVGLLDLIYRLLVLEA